MSQKKNRKTNRKKFPAEYGTKRQRERLEARVRAMEDDLVAHDTLTPLGLALQKALQSTRAWFDAVKSAEKV